MANGYQHDEEHDFSELDEWLCEYVDGAIDPVVREALEEYMQANPALAIHVERLRQTRSLLCRYGCRHHAPRSLQPRLRRRLASEYVQETQPLLTHLNNPLITLASICSVVAVLLIISSTQPAVAPSTQYAIESTIPTLNEQARSRSTPSSALTTNHYYAFFAAPAHAIASPSRSQALPTPTLIPANKSMIDDSSRWIGHRFASQPTP